MKHSDDYIQYLLENARSGSKDSFLELCEILYQDVFCTAFQLLNDYNIASEITKETFVLGWKNISKYKGEKECKIWIREIAVILCFYNFKNEKKQPSLNAMTYKKMVVDNRNPLEEEYTDLTLYQKLSVILASKLKFSLYDMRNVFEDLSEIEVRDLYKDAYSKLIRLSSQKNLQTLSEDEIQISVNAEERGDIKLSGFDESILNSIAAFKVELDNIFTSIKAKKSLLQKIKDNFLSEDVVEKEIAAELQSGRRKNYRKSIFDKAGESAVNDLNVNKKMHLGNKKVRELSLTRNLIISIVVLSVLIIGFFAIQYAIELSKNNTPWKIQSNAGTHSITGELFNSYLNEGNTLRTDSSSSLSIKVEELGVFIINDQAEFRLINGYETNNIVNFNGDHLEFFSSKESFTLEQFSQEPVLTIGLPEGTIETEISDFILHTSEGITELYVSDGWVEFKNNNSTFILGKGYLLDLTNGLSIPYYKGTSDVLINAANDPATSSDHLRAILSESKEHDILTLWHLFNFVEKNQQHLIVKKLAEFIPIIDQTTTKDSLALSSEDSQLMLESIKWILAE